jgi:hypothetical protein
MYCRYGLSARATHFTTNVSLDYHSPSSVSGADGDSCGRPIDDATIAINDGEYDMSKSQDAKKNVKKAPAKTPKEKKEAKRLKKAERKH